MMSKADQRSSIYQGWTPEELVRAAGPERQEYRSEALEDVEAELTRRGIVGEEREDLESRVALEEQSEAPEPTGIGGWLLLFCITVALNSSVLVIAGIYWVLSNSVDPILLLPSLTVGGYGCWVFVLLIRKQRAAPRHAVLWLIAEFVLVLLYAGRAYWTEGELGMELTRVLEPLAWLAYLIESRRVATTYGTPSRDSRPAGGAMG